MRRLPLHPPWLVVPIVVGMVAAGIVASESWLLMFGFAMVAVVAATLGLDGWLERYRPRRRGQLR